VQADGIGYFAGTKQVTVGNTPAAPTGLSAAAVSGHEINLAWTDNSNIEVGYQIEQSPDGEGDWVPVAWTDANTVYYSLPGPFAPSSSYYFRVKAFTESAESQYSNVADVTTGAWPAARVADANAYRIPRPPLTLPIRTITCSEPSSPAGWIAGWPPPSF